MPSPYRQSDNTPPAPLAELAWRRRVTRSALWAELLVWGEIVVLLVATQWLPARFALPGAVAWFAIGAALAVATWMYTAPRPRGRVGWRGWLLRAAVPLSLGVIGLLLLGMHVEIASYVLGALVVVASLAYSWPLRTRAGPWRLREWYLYLLLFGLLFTPFQFLPPVEPLWRSFGLCVALAASSGASALRRALLPIDVRWWFDDQTGTPGEWAALLVYRNGLAQVLFIDERPGWFQTQDDATIWLLQNGCLTAERALAERLVDRVPPDVLPVPRRRKRPRAEPSAPRVRVAADDVPEPELADEEPALDEAEADPVDELPLDDAEPPRAVAVRRADE